MRKTRPHPDYIRLVCVCWSTDQPHLKEKHTHTTIVPCRYESIPVVTVLWRERTGDTRMEAADREGWGGRGGAATTAGGEGRKKGESLFSCELDKNIRIKNRQTQSRRRQTGDRVRRRLEPREGVRDAGVKSMRRQIGRAHV